MEQPNFPRSLPRVLACIFAALLCGCGEGGRSARDAAEEMSRHFSGQQFAEAYAQTATAFRFRRSQNYFEARVRDLGLCEARGVKWGEPERNGRLATIPGVFTLGDGSKFALNFTFAREEGDWRLIEARSLPAPGVRAEDVFAVAARTSDTVKSRAMEFLEPSAADVPSEPQLRQLAEDSLLLWNGAILNGGDFSELYAAASDRWKYRGRDPRELSGGGLIPIGTDNPDADNRDRRLTVAGLTHAFAAAVEAKVDISPIRGKKMFLSDPARVNSDGVLTLRGTFDEPVFRASLPGVPQKVDFMLEYVREGAKWKLFGITVNIVATEQRLAPNP